MTRHKWSEWTSAGHGSGDGTPAGVISGRHCLICGAAERRDSAVSTHTGGTRPAHYWIDAHGERCSERPECPGYDPHDDGYDDEPPPDARMVGYSEDR